MANTQKQITSLTPEQEARLPIIRDKWLAIGLRTGGKIDRAAARPAIDAAYQAAGLAAPKWLLVLPSPRAVAIACARLLACDELRETASEGAVQAWLETTPKTPPKPDDIRKALQSIYLNQWEAGWLAWVDVFRELGLECTKKAVPLLHLAEIGSCWALWSLAAFASERASVLHRDDRNRLHCEDGPAIGWDDGFGVFAWHGVRVKSHVIEHPEQITLQEIRDEKNAEVRRVLRERFGEGRYLSEIGAKVLDVDYEGAKQGAAPRCLLQDDEGTKWLVGTDGSTGRVYHMEAPANAQKCRDAHNRLAGFDEARIVAKS